MTRQDVIKEFPSERQIIVDSGDMGKNKHLFPVFLECDVTEARRIIRHDKQATGVVHDCTNKIMSSPESVPEQDRCLIKKEHGISFTAFIAHCLAQSVYRHKELNSYRKGRNQMIVFEDVDLVITQEVETANGYFPGAVTIRAAQNCTIHGIQAQQKASIDSVNPDDVLTPELKSFVKLPAFIRKFILWYMQHDPIRHKEKMGTVLLSSVGMHGNIRWFYAKPNYTLSVFLGGITKKLQLINGEIVTREYLHVTLMFDHDVVDAAPLARFAQDFKETVEACVGLPKLANATSEHYHHHFQKLG